MKPTDAEELSHLDEVDRNPAVHRATEPDEDAVLDELYGPDSVHTEATAPAMLVEARKSLGLSGRPNYITRDYASRHGSEFLSASWCDMAVTYWARASGNAAAVLPGGDRAYTVWHAQDFQKAGRWHAGTTAGVNAARPGDIVFFDWDASNSVGAIDHVGVVEVALGDGRVQTIEGNTSDAVRRRVRGASVIAGYGRPQYTDNGGASAWMETLVKNLPLLKKGATGENVQTLRGLLLARSHPEVKTVEGPFDATVEKAVKAVQKWGGVDADGIVGPQTWPVLLRVHD
ncbi:CHAP domain-containing protein [Actinomadura parmotrematis]|uniref:CHAP domain-containing protein n=1 Tax=Actinomadura parmotrematis TaxID=2864039 RepID=A0ABS7FXG1_9ACTN|nr:CHAP domain-containing protein [Actinomadura parmotrematis]MBW8485106.1 CHAP domain-containing protein [Actinomadura parmotrematis]